MSRERARRRPLRRVALAPVVLITVLAAAFSAACAGGGPSTPPLWDSRSVGQSIEGVPFTPVIVNSNIGRGPTRLAVALFKQGQTLVLADKVTARIFEIDADPDQHPANANLRGSYTFTARTIDVADHGTMRFDRDGDGRARPMIAVALRDTPGVTPPAPAHDGALSTIFTTMVDFDSAGMWGAEIQVKIGSRTYHRLLVTFAVLEKTAEPSVGDEAPRTKQKIATDVSDLADLDSSKTPNPALHNITVADAIASGKPTLVVFVTPVFCQTRFCGPVLTKVVIPAQQRYQGRAHVIHIEPYDVPTARRGTLIAAPAGVEWNLRAEPFIAILDRGGRLTAKFEGIIDLDEVTQALDAVLAAK